MNPLIHLSTKVKYLLHCESKLDDAQKALHQWQLFTRRGKIDYVVGKGGVNTCFYILGKGERILCYPQELVEVLTKLSKEKYAGYRICTQDKKFIGRTMMTIEEAATTPPSKSGLYIVGLTDTNKLVRIMYSTKGLSGITWTRFKQ